MNNKEFTLTELIIAVSLFLTLMSLVLGLSIAGCVAYKGVKAINKISTTYQETPEVVKENVRLKTKAAAKATTKTYNLLSDAIRQGMEEAKTE